MEIKYYVVHQELNIYVWKQKEGMENFVTFVHNELLLLLFCLYLLYLKYLFNQKNTYLYKENFTILKNIIKKCSLQNWM